MSPSSTSLSDACDTSQHVGLVNLGNTCFFNSVLQAASVTRSLHALYHPGGEIALAEAATQSGLITASFGTWRIHRRKVPALLLVDEEAKRPIIPLLTDEQVEQLLKSLPLSNAFRFTLEKTWRSTATAAGSKTASHSPKTLLKVLAKKFDQFGHYEQQDAHELLRLLLDAMRMEELDFIKLMGLKGRLPSDSSYRSDTSSCAPIPLTASEGQDDAGISFTARPREEVPPSEQDNDTGDVTPMASASHQKSARQLSWARAHGLHSTSSTNDAVLGDMTTLVDVLWGGQLASMVVCEGCRYVSHTYEDFLDLSLPLRPEDAASAGLRDRRANRVRLMTERWRRPTPPAVSSRQLPRVGYGGEKETILKQTLGACDGSDDVTTKAQGTEKARRVSSSQKTDGAVSADEDVVTLGSNSWSAWASTLGRSRSARPPSAASSKSGMPSDHIERDKFDMPDIASMALTPESPASCSTAHTEETLRCEVTAALEARSKGSRDLLTALSNASRSNSRAGSRNRDGVTSRSTSPGAQGATTPKVESAHAGANHHSGHSKGLLHHVQQREHNFKREPSRQAQYIARVFGEPGSTSSPSMISSDPVKTAFRTKVRAEQAGTGLATALRAFTTSEVLSEDNFFNCKRCWRRLNPVKGVERERLRRRRARRGKNPSGSEDSDDDDDAEGGEERREPFAEALASSSSMYEPVAHPTLVAPKPQRALSSVLNTLSAPTSEDETSDAEVAAVDSARMVTSEDRVRTRSPPSDHLEAGVQGLASMRGMPQPDVLPTTFSRRSSVFSAIPKNPSSPALAVLECDSMHEAKQPPDHVVSVATDGPKLLGGSTLPICPPESGAHLGMCVESERAELLAIDSESSRSLSVKRGGTSEASSISKGSLPDQGLSVLETASSTSIDSLTHWEASESLVPGPPANNPLAMPKPFSRPAQAHHRRSAQSLPRRALKRYLISQFPPILVLHLKRFQFNASSRSSSFFSSSANLSFRKINDVVTYPEWLDMAEWMAPPREEYDRHGKMKETSDPAIWEIYRQGLGEGALARERVPVNHETIVTPTLTNDGSSLKRKPSRWSRPFSRGPSASSNTSLSDTAGGTLAPSTSTPSRSRVTSPALAQTGKQAPRKDAAATMMPAETELVPSSPLYRLYSVVAHHGATMHGGHYTSYVLSDRCSGLESRNGKDGRHSAGVGATAGESGSRRPSEGDPPNRGVQAPESRQWVHCSDSIIKPSTLDQVLKCKDAYMVWYERVA